MLGIRLNHNYGKPKITKDSSLLIPSVAKNASIINSLKANIKATKSCLKGMLRMTMIDPLTSLNKQVFIL